MTKQQKESFSGFDKGALDLLSKMPRWDQEAYGKQKDVLERGLRTPGWLLVSQLADALGASLEVNKRSSVSPFHRDLRFSKSGTSRYKDHLLLTMWEGKEKKTAPTIWLRVDSTSIGFASGLAFTPTQRDVFRKVVGSDPGKRLAREVSRLEKKHRGHGFDLAGATLKRVPSPFSGDHPRADLLRMTSFQVRYRELHPAGVESARLLEWCKERLDDLLGVHRFLVQEVDGGA